MLQNIIPRDFLSKKEAIIVLNQVPCLKILATARNYPTRFLDIRTIHTKKFLLFFFVTVTFSVKYLLVLPTINFYQRTYLITFSEISFLIVFFIQWNLKHQLRKLSEVTQRNSYCIQHEHDSEIVEILNSFKHFFIIPCTVTIYSTLS